MPHLTTFAVERPDHEPAGPARAGVPLAPLVVLATGLAVLGVGSGLAATGGLSATAARANDAATPSALTRPVGNMQPAGAVQLVGSTRTSGPRVSTTGATISPVSYTR